MLDTGISQNRVKQSELLINITSGKVFKVNGSIGVALIICHPHYAEIVGRGGAVGGFRDLDTREVILIGNVSLTYLSNSADKLKSYQVREKWVEVTQKVTGDEVKDKLDSLRRSRAILLMLERYCGLEAIAHVPDEILAQLVGVLPQTMKKARDIVKHQTQSAGQDTCIKVKEMIDCISNH
jgi:hypothetical protein